MSTLQSLEKRLSDLGLELERARARRLESQAELRRLSALAERGDNKAKFAQEPVNKRVEADSTLIVSIERETGHVRRQCDLARGQLAAIARKQAESSAAPRNQLFEVVCPDGRKVRHRHESADALQKELQPRYSVVGQVFGANADDTGGVVSMPGAPSMLKALLESQGEELLAFLAAHGIVGAEKTVIVLPANGKELQ